MILQPRLPICLLCVMNIPEQVSELANIHGYNSVVLSASSPEGSIYSVGCVDGDGFELPVGLPTFILFDGQSCRLVDGEEGLTLSSRLFGDK
ncbi:hypothetical protein DW889_07940 [Bacteroides stercoris]|uniref:Uncharacterized protein n=3 Tax=Bacteroidia TaxID=200643 RepID=A0A413V6Z7_BACSE|nr:hypothetical protein DW889_07940 [Bacteroides stercoris]